MTKKSAFESFLFVDWLAQPCYHETLVKFLNQV